MFGRWRARRAAKRAWRRWREDQLAAADSSRLDRWDQERTEATERLLWLMHEDDAAGDETA